MLLHYTGFGTESLMSLVSVIFFFWVTMTVIVSRYIHSSTDFDSPLCCVFGVNEERYRSPIPPKVSFQKFCILCVSTESGIDLLSRQKVSFQRLIHFVG